MKANNYKEAVNWLNNSYILCNNIGEIDPSIFDNANFDWIDEDGCEEVEIYQYYLSDCTQDDVCYLSDRFNLLFTYSNLLDMYVLCVDHWGTAWNCVSVFDREYPTNEED